MFLFFLVAMFVIVCFVGRDRIEFQVALNKAFYYSEHGEYELEVREYDKLIEQNPEIYELYVNKAIALANSNKINEAISVFKKAESLNSSDPELYYNIAHLYDIIKDDELYQFYIEKGKVLEFQQNVEEE